MRRFVLFLGSLILAAPLLGCSGGGLEAGVPKDIPTGPPQPPPGSTKEMAELAKRPRGPIAPRPPGNAMPIR
jgi:hypothetical protein